MWHSINKIKPQIGVQLLFSGTNGNGGKFIATGKYNPDFRPQNPYLDDTNEAFASRGFQVTHWTFLAPHQIDFPDDIAERENTLRGLMLALQFAVNDCTRAGQDAKVINATAEICTKAATELHTLARRLS